MATIDPKDLLHSEGLLWISSSGSSRQKLIGLSSEALFNSAASVNQWLDVNTSDIWAIALPMQHIASIAVIYRSRLSGCKTVRFEKRWQPFEYCDFLKTSKASICSLVPTQVHDLVNSNLRPHKELRTVLVGGARLEESLYEKGKELGWPLLPTYGMTECASQIACAKPGADEQDMYVLPHLEVSTLDDGRLAIKGNSLLSKLIDLDQNLIREYGKDSWYETSDLGFVNDGRISILGRADRKIKIKGSFVNLEHYEQVAQEFFKDKNGYTFVACAVPDSRLGNKVIIAYNGQTFDAELLKEFYAVSAPDLPPVSGIYKLDKLPLLANGKIDYQAITNSVEEDG